MSVFFSSWKTGFKSWLDTSLIPPQYLAVCRASSAFSYRNLDSFSTPSVLIKNVSTSSIASRHLVDRLSFYSGIWWFVPWHLFDTCICRWLFFSTPSSTDVSIPIDTFIYRDLLLVYLSFLVRSDPYFSWSLSRYFSDFSPKLYHLTLIFVPQAFFKLSQDFLHLVSF